MVAELQETKGEEEQKSKMRLLYFNKRLLFNARAASRACGLFVQTMESQRCSTKALPVCLHGFAGRENTLMSHTGQLRFTLAFYHIWRYTLKIPQTSRPADLCLEKLPFEVYYPMFRLANWSKRLETGILCDLWTLIKPITNERAGELGRIAYAWQKVCHYIVGGRSGLPIPLKDGLQCWYSFYEECQHTREETSGFVWPPI